MESNYTVGLDIGSSKVVVLIGELLTSGTVNIVGVGTAPSRGVDKGSITNLDLIVNSITTALKQAEDMADCTVSSVNLSVSGAHIESMNKDGTWVIGAHEVSDFDVESVLHNAQSVKLRDEQRLLHVVPQEYAIDSQSRIKNPIGLSGVKLKADVHLITSHSDLVKNLEKAVERCGLSIDQLTVSSVASSEAILSEDEKELGVCMIDMGSGTMDVSIFIAGSLHYSLVLDYAGSSVTNDIAIAFSSPPASAEAVKVNYGCLNKKLVQEDEIIELPSVGGRAARSLQRSILVDVIEPRYTELLTLVKKRIESLEGGEHILHQLSAGLVITGGAAQIQGLSAVAESVFGHAQVRIGKPENLQGLVEDVSSPAYSTAVGLLRYKNNEFTTDEVEVENRLASLFAKIKNWIKKEY
ncbi:cell division protein FtsA [Psychromonas aquatilis]|uniref:Cell division protein FtsA n=1 Tax=Psychromonas aquatilis TaxID=2005072 RepID=A0ABU9GQ49_9GAMM